MLEPEGGFCRGLRGGRGWVAVGAPASCHIMPERGRRRVQADTTTTQSRGPVTSTDTPSAPEAGARKTSPPKIVSIGGGTGSYNLLSGLKHRDCRLTAVVTTMDSGGSSGRLRDEFGHLPPGDLRQCLLALSPDDHSGMVLRGLFNYRFDKGNGLDGHSFGNLFLTALTEITGSAEQAIDEMGRLLNIKGRVLPVTLANADLCARLRDGSVIIGETNIDRRSAGSAAPIDYVYLEPSTAKVHPPTAAAIEEADAIVIGPGDLYTSIVPNLLVEGVTEALARCRGVRIYVCNLMTKPGESDGFKASDFIREVGKVPGAAGGARPRDRERPAPAGPCRGALSRRAVHPSPLRRGGVPRSGGHGAGPPPRGCRRLHPSRPPPPRRRRFRSAVGAVAFRARSLTQGRPRTIGPRPRPANGPRGARV